MTDLNWSELWDEDEQRYRVQTRDGLEVRLWTISAHCGAPVRGEINTGNGFVIGVWTISGRYVDNRPGADLVPEPRTVRHWVNVYKLSGGKYLIPQPHETKSDALTRANKNSDNPLTYIATIPVEWTEE